MRCPITSELFGLGREVAGQRALAEAPSIDGRLDRLSRMKSDDREAIRGFSAEICRTVEGIAIRTEDSAQTFAVTANVSIAGQA